MNRHAVQASVPKQLVDQLAAINTRLASIPTQQLPFFASQISEQIWSCRKAMSAAEQRARGDEGAAAVHRLRTQISTLLQDRTVEGRWSAVLLTKATIEAGGVSFIGSSATWVKYLLQILKKGADPSTTRSFAAINLLRIFTLTWGVPSLIRELTTPNLPSFLSVCITNIHSPWCSSSELQTYLEAFYTLLPKHPNIFRTNELAIRRFCCKILQSPTASLSEGSPRHFTQQHQQSARVVLALLHHCAQKQGASDKWVVSFDQLVKATHRTCDHLFRSLHEDWVSTTGYQSSAVGQNLRSGDCAIVDNDEADLGPWQGVYIGAERLMQLLKLLITFLDVGTGSTVTFKIGAIVDLLARVLSVSKSNRAQQEVRKQERDDLCHVLPTLHVGALNLVEALLLRLEESTIGLTQNLLELVRSSFELHQEHADLSSAAFQLLARMLTMYGSCFAQEDVKSLNGMLKACCHALLSPESVKPPAPGGLRTQIISAPNIDKAEFRHDPSAMNTCISKSYRRCAQQVLLAAMLKLNPSHVPSSTRALMDRTAILSNDRAAMLASVMNPPSRPDGSYQTSILPIVARMFPSEPQVEILLRPRMPLVAQRGIPQDAYAGDEESEDGASSQIADSSFPAASGQGGTVEDADADADEDGEPTSGLLSALAEDAKRSNNIIHDVASSWPANGPAESTLQKHKRTDSSEMMAESSAKRMRPSSVAGPLLLEHARELPGRTALTADADITLAAQDNAPTQEDTTIISDLHSTTAQTTVAEAEADDSDFEMPPLTMEQDTDPED